MTGLVLVGPFLTRTHAARLAGISRQDIQLRPDLLRLGGVWLEETYFAFQFGRYGIRPELARVVRLLKEKFEDGAIADWLVTPNPRLFGSTPLDSLKGSPDPERVLAAAKWTGPRPTEQAPRPRTDTLWRVEHRHKTRPVTIRPWRHNSTKRPRDHVLGA